MHLEDFTLDVEGRKVECLLAGPGHSPPGPDTALVMTFGMIGRASLEAPGQNEVANVFLGAGHIALSFDLPHHGGRVGSHGDGIRGICKAFVAGADPFLEFIADGMAAIDVCLARGIGTSEKICASGVSRGAYFALRLAAADRRIKGVAGIAPVTDWRVLKEFVQVRHRPDVADLALENWAAPLADRPVYLAIGNRDDRVGTAECVRFAQRLLETETLDDGEQPSFELHVTRSPGHALGEEWRTRGAEYLLSLCGPSGTR